MIAKAQGLRQLSSLITVPVKTSEGEEINGRDIVDKEVVITSVTLQQGRGESKGTTVGAKFFLLIPTSTDDILEDGRSVFIVSRNETMVTQAVQLVQHLDKMPILATLRKQGRSYYWS